MTQPPYPPGPPQPGPQQPYRPGPQQPYQPGPQQPYQQPYPPGPQQPYQAGFAAPPVQKKGKGCIIAAIIVGVILVAVIVGVVAAIGAIGKGVSDATTGEHTITFKVETTAKTMVIYGTTSGTTQETVTTSWTKEKKVTGIDGATVIASLDSDAPDNATISCEILIDGKSKSKESGTGKSASVSCAAATVK